MPVTLVDGVTATVEDNTITVKGPKGSLNFTFKKSMKVSIHETEVVVERPSDSKEDKSIHGTTRALINNMVVGVSKGYTKKLKMIGVGYRAIMKDGQLVISAGYSHPVIMDIPEGIEIEVPKNTLVNISGISKQLVGEFAANIRGVRPPEPYLGKGIRYVDEYVRRKEGKTAKK
jgi:large subunit ribosomal protein L6